MKGKDIVEILIREGISRLAEYVLSGKPSGPKRPKPRQPRERRPKKQGK